VKLLPVAGTYIKSELLRTRNERLRAADTHIEPEARDWKGKINFQKQLK
jgi:hypothetical protein